MEQVLHPEKYLDRVDEPMEVDPIETPGVSPESEGRVGELYIRALFEPVLTREEATLAAGGWGGDRYAVWTDSEGRYHLLWRTLWDTEEDADEFFRALERLASARFGVQPTSEVDPGRAQGTGPDGSRTSIGRRGREVLLEREGFR